MYEYIHGSTPFHSTKTELHFPHIIYSSQHISTYYIQDTQSINYWMHEYNLTQYHRNLPNGERNFHNNNSGTLLPLSQWDESSAAVLFIIIMDMYNRCSETLSSRKKNRIFPLLDNDIKLEVFPHPYPNFNWKHRNSYPDSILLFREKNIYIIFLLSYF